MKLTTLRISNIRNHKLTEVHFDKQMNVFYGLNGSGKTSILEAISVCSYSKSFQRGNDSSLMSYGEENYVSEIKAINDLGITYFAKVKCPSLGRKDISSTFGTNLSARELIGEMPLVVLSPDLKSITAGSPQDRRDFIDKILCQSSRSYFDKLMDFKKILRQRNSILNQIKLDYSSARSQFSSWTDLFISISADLIVMREKFIRQFCIKFSELYDTISSSRENVSLSYCPNGNELINNSDNVQFVIDRLTEISENLSAEELRRGVSLFGPQKDELSIIIGKGTARDAASQGQHKSLLIALKFAEFDYLKEIRNETPIVLLDDIFSELDPERIHHVLSVLAKNSAQTFITLTDYNYLRDILANHDYSLYLVENGIVLKTN